MHTFDIAQHFIHYYQDKGYEILPRSSLLDPATPMTFVGSAGLAQIETGIEQSEDHTGERYVLTQTCFRHFDLDKVGHSPIHLSLFEMGGAFAFGQVSREDTLERIWDFLIEDLGFDKTRLWATYFAGGELDGHPFEPDMETRQTWERLGVRPTQIVAAGMDLSFWKQGGGLSGETRFRKCGPTTELFYDYGPELQCGPMCSPGCTCGRFVEIANILFIHSYIDQLTKALMPLRTPFDETVIGVERLAMTLQQAASVFELASFMPLIQYVRSYSQQIESSINQVVGEQVIADHIRALLFLAADKAPYPGKGGRARIVRLLIRGIITQQKILGIHGQEFIPVLIDVTLHTYKEKYPFLRRGREQLLSYFQLEKPKFERTLSRGYRYLEEFIQGEEKNRLSGEHALDLVKRHGFPFSLLEATLSKREIDFDICAYRKAYAEWRRMVAQ